MAKQWYIQLMGSNIGPLSPGEMKEKVRNGQIQAETLVRQGQDGKWQAADRVKGLLGPSAVTQAAHQPESARLIQEETERLPAPSSEPQRRPVSAAPAIPEPVADENFSYERTYHLQGQTADEPAKTDSEPAAGEFDFFQFVGFDQAIGHALYDALAKYCEEKKESMTHVTRRALAEFLGRKDLLQPAAKTAES